MLMINGRVLEIRIEDDILVTESGNENLTDATPTDPQDIQSLMS